MILGVPYDAEIEYLESTGTQYIDTDVSLSMLMGASAATEITIAWTNTTDAGYQVNGWNNNPQIGIRGGSPAYWQNYATGSQPVSAMMQYHAILDLSGARGVLRVDGFSPLMAGGNTAPDSRAFLLGAMHGNNNTIANFAKARFYACKLRSTTIVRDFIPVRIGQTGYMYDRVTRRLFGNKGTGSFVLGPDVAKPVMGLYGMRKFYSTTDYIQDGLVAMWDGKENAGFGQHGSSGNIVDLTGNGYDLVLTGSDSRGSDYFALDTKGFYTVTNGSKIISAFDAGCLECETVAAGDNGEHMLSFFGSSTSGFMVRPWFYTVSSTNNRYGTRGTVGTVTKDAGFYNQPNSYVGRIARHATRFNAPNFTAECNLTAKATGTISAYTRENSNMILGARASYTGVNRWSGRYYNVRLYNRALSAAEIAHNYAIDKARFNLP